MAEASARSLTSSLDKLQISQSAKSKDAADDIGSWEDEADEEDSGAPTPIKNLHPSDYPEPPPPTPASPSFSSSTHTQGLPYQTFPPYGMESEARNRSPASPPRRRNEDDERRPEKSTSVASRLIAAGIGQKAPKRTKEQKEYDQAVKAQEKKKRDQAKAEEEQRKKDVEKAKQAIWED